MEPARHRRRRVDRLAHEAGNARLAARLALELPAADRPGPRELRIASPDETASGFYLRLEVKDRPGALARIAGALAVWRIVGG